MGSGPQLADLDGDGRAEVISGSFAARIYRWPLLKSGALGAREDLVRLTHAAFKVPHVACHVVDWDGDGDSDLLAGARRGEVFLLRNTGSITEPHFAVPIALEAKGTPFEVAGGDAGPHAADWDGDGDLDLLVGDDRGGRFVEQRCKTAESCAMRAKPWVTDWNGDGRPDLLVGDFHDHRTAARLGNEHMHGWVWLYMRKAAKRERPHADAPHKRQR